MSRRFSGLGVMSSSVARLKNRKLRFTPVQLNTLCLADITRLRRRDRSQARSPKQHQARISQVSRNEEVKNQSLKPQTARCQKQTGMCLRMNNIPGYSRKKCQLRAPRKRECQTGSINYAKNDEKTREKTFPNRPGMSPEINQIQEIEAVDPGMLLKTKADRFAM